MDELAAILIAILFIAVLIAAFTFLIWLEDTKQRHIDKFMGQCTKEEREFIYKFERAKHVYIFGKSKHKKDKEQCKTKN